MKPRRDHCNKQTEDTGTRYHASVEVLVNTFLHWSPLFFYLFNVGIQVGTASVFIFAVYKDDTSIDISDIEHISTGLTSTLLFVLPFLFTTTNACRSTIITEYTNCLIRLQQICSFDTVAQTREKRFQEYRDTLTNTLYLHDQGKIGYKPEALKRLVKDVRRFSVRFREKNSIDVFIDVSEIVENLSDSVEVLVQTIGSGLPPYLTSIIFMLLTAQYGFIAPFHYIHIHGVWTILLRHTLFCLAGNALYVFCFFIKNPFYDKSQNSEIRKIYRDFS